MNAKMKMTALLLAAVITLSFPLQTFAVNFDGLEEAVAPVAEPSSEQSMVEPDEIAIAAAPVPESNVSYAETPASPDNAAADPSETDVPESPAEDTLALPAVYDDTATSPARRDTLLVDDSITLSAIDEELSNMFQFTLDPYKLIPQTGAARYNGVSFENTNISGVFFKDRYVNGGNDYMSHLSDFIKFTNNTADPVYVAVQMSVSGLDEAGILMEGQTQETANGKWKAKLADNAPRLKFTVNGGPNNAVQNGGIELDYDVIPNSGYVFFDRAFYLNGVTGSTDTTVTIERAGAPSANYRYSNKTVAAGSNEAIKKGTTNQGITSSDTSVSFQLSGQINNSNNYAYLWDSIGDLDNASLTVTWKVWKAGTPYKYEKQGIGTLVLDLDRCNFGEYDQTDVMADTAVTVSWLAGVSDVVKYEVGNLLMEYGLAMTLPEAGDIEAADFAVSQEAYEVSVDTNGTTVLINAADTGSRIVSLAFGSDFDGSGISSDRAVVTLVFKNADGVVEDVPDTTTYDSTDNLPILNPTDTLDDSEGRSVQVDVQDAVSSASISWAQGITSNVKNTISTKLQNDGITLTIDENRIISGADLNGYQAVMNYGNILIKSADGNTTYAKITLTLGSFSNTVEVSGAVKMGITYSQTAETLNIKNPSDSFDSGEGNHVSDVAQGATIAWVTGTADTVKDAIIGQLEAPGINITVDYYSAHITGASMSGYTLTTNNSTDVFIKSSNGETSYAKITFTLATGASGTGTVQFGDAAQQTQPVNANVQYGNPVRLDVANASDNFNESGVTCGDVFDTLQIQWANDTENSAVLAALADPGVTLTIDSSLRVTAPSCAPYSLTIEQTEGGDNVIIIKSGTEACAMITFVIGMYADEGTGTFKLVEHEEEEPEELQVLLGGSPSAITASLAWNTTDETQRSTLRNELMNNGFVITVASGRITSVTAEEMVNYGGYELTTSSSGNVLIIEAFIDGEDVLLATVTFNLTSGSDDNYDVLLQGADEDEMVDTILVTLRFPTSVRTSESGTRSGTSPLFAEAPEDNGEDTVMDMDFSDNVIDDVDVTSGSSGSIHNADLDGSADVDAAPEVEPVSADPDESPAEVVMDSTSGTDTAPDSTVDDEEDEIVTDDAVDTDSDSGNVGFSEANNMIPVQADPEEEGALNSMETVDNDSMEPFDAAESNDDSAESDDDAAESNDNSAVEETNDVAVVETSDDSAESGNDDAGTVETSDDATVDSSSESAVETSTETATSSDDSTSGSSSDSGSTSENSSDSASESSSDSAE